MKKRQTTEIALKVSVRIRHLRKNRGLTQEKLSELSGIEHKHIQLLESGNPPNAKIGSIYKIAQGLGLSLYEFFSDEMFRVKKSESKKSPILKAKIPNPRKILFQNEYWYSVFSHSPLTRGHTVIYSKRDVSNYFELYPEENHALTDIKKKVYEYLEVEFKPDGFNIGMDIGYYAGQELNLVTVHIVPRYKGDCRNPLLSGIKKVLGV